MTDQEIDVAIAEVCGATKKQLSLWKKFQSLLAEWRRLPRRSSFSGLALQEKLEAAEDALDGYRLPNYCGDLNAIHGAVRHLHATSIADYWSYLDALRRCVAVENGKLGPGQYGFYTEDASARQRAQALLIAKGKWRDA